MILIVLVVIMFLLAFLVGQKMTDEQKEKFANVYSKVFWTVSIIAICLGLFLCSI
jgi:heme/copper-type cytochrome/quinol oxidase subunit 2